MSDSDAGDNERTIYATKKKREKKDVVFYTHFEEVLQKINPFGPYQIFTVVVILYASIEWAGNSTFMDVLGSLEPDWNCTLKNGGYQTGAYMRVYLHFLKAPTNDGSCAFLKNNCSSYTAERDSVEFVSLVADFKMICDDADKVEWIQVIQAGGSLVGSIIGGHMGDHLGRQTIFFTGQLLIIITSMMSTASQNWIAYASIQGVNCFLYGVIELNLTKTMFMKNGWVSDAPFSLNGTNISECSSYVYLGREVNMANDLAPELSRRKRAAWGAFKSVEEVVKKTKNVRLRAHLSLTTLENETISLTWTALLTHIYRNLP
ncbi:unnamed protein product [Heligmosomoides polygyrus]|uniref:MFS domain-containing protein n=1 Tax=Heligmosomoides polygyrus TaxID=6339 RepID=A0A3P7Y4S8_HELPZ|nr:unnamed protein product [Heligmosomoides polygyrus]